MRLYKIGIRNGKYFPSFKSAFVTVDYIEKVRAGQIDCPNYSDIRLKPCDDAPDVKLLVEEVIKV